jgi:hypothetical protein
MILRLLLPIAHVNDTGAGGVLSLLFPLVFVFIVLGLWAVSLRRRRKRE